MTSVQDFYAPRRWTRKFWEWGDAYTIVLYRHIGLDIGGWGGKTATVPALIAGRVTRVVYTVSMGMCVEVQVGNRYYTYCHLADDRLPREGAWLNQGDRVGRLAVGPKTPRNHPDYPGSSWSGVHLHLVISNKSRAAYTYPRVAGSEFYDPAEVINSVLAAPAGSGTPLEKEDDLGSLDNTEENYRTFATFLQRALSWDIRDGKGAAGADPTLGLTLWDRIGNLGTAVAEVPESVWEHAIPAQTPEGINQEVSFPARGFVASSNAQIGALREVVATLAAGQGLDPKAIEDAAERGAQKALDNLTLVPKNPPK